MAKITSLSLKNNAAAAVPFNFESNVGRVTTLRDSSATVFGKAARVYLEVKAPANGSNGLIRFKETLKVPNFNADGTVRDYCTRIVEDLIPASTSDIERKEFTARAAAMGSDASLKAGQDNLDFWS